MLKGPFELIEGNDMWIINLKMKVFLKDLLDRKCLHMFSKEEDISKLS